MVYVIEGLLKADISHCLTNRTFAAIAGANNTSQLDTLFALLAQNGTEEIIEAHDMDKYSNQMTSNGASKIYLMARKNGMACRRLTWNPNYKGFDDWQLALREKEQKEKEVQRMNFKQQYLCGKCDFTYIDGCVELWHTRAEKDLDLTEYLGLTKEEYQIFLAQGNRALKDILDSQRVFRRFCIYHFAWVRHRRYLSRSSNWMHCVKLDMNSRLLPPIRRYGAQRSVAQRGRMTWKCWGACSWTLMSICRKITEAVRWLHLMWWNWTAKANAHTSM